MVIERFKPGRAPDIYRRFSEKGRMMPGNIRYLDSWITADISTCYQLMEAEDPAHFEAWTRNWSDLVDFDIRPIISSDEARAMALGDAPAR